MHVVATLAAPGAEPLVHYAAAPARGGPRHPCEPDSPPSLVAHRPASPPDTHASPFLRAAVSDGVQRRFCPRCSSLVVHGENTTTRLRQGSTKRRCEVVTTCTVCSAVARTAAALAPLREARAAAPSPDAAAAAAPPTTPVAVSPAAAPTGSTGHHRSQKKRKKSLFSLDRAGNQSAHPGRADPSFTWDPFTA